METPPQEVHPMEIDPVTVFASACQRRRYRVVEQAISLSMKITRNEFGLVHEN